MNRSGFTLIEVLMASLALAVISISLAEFTYTTCNVSFDNSMQAESADQIRLVNEVIDNEVSKSSYIYPGNVSIALTGGENITISSANSVAILIPGDTIDDPPTYTFEAFYFKKNQTTGRYDLYMFKGSSAIQWPQKNVVPANNIPANNNTSFDGSPTLIASDFISGNNPVTYILNNDKGLIDTALLGVAAGGFATNNNALISGIKWSPVIYKNVNQTVNIESLSKNVPRYFVQ